MKHSIALTGLLAFLAVLASLAILSIQGFPTLPETQTPDACRALDEKACLLNSNCESVMGSSACNWDTCTTDIVFRECRKSGLDSAERAELSADCRSLGGHFGKNSFGEYRCLTEKGSRIRCPETDGNCKAFGAKLEVYRNN